MGCNHQTPRVPGMKAVRATVKLTLAWVLRCISMLSVASYPGLPRTGYEAMLSEQL